MDDTATRHAADSGRGVPYLLLVEPDRASRWTLLNAATPVAHVVSQPSFTAAQRYLLSGASLDFLVTNLRLGVYNGLHLVYLAAGRDVPPRSIVYTDRHESGLARETQQAGAFYDTRGNLPTAIAAYLRAALPPQDQRQATPVDRRSLFRGGRRCGDRSMLSLPARSTAL
jgi:hypothetical protein